MDCRAREELADTVERMGDIEGMIVQQRPRDTWVQTGFVADNLEATARRLEQAYRTIVTPRIEKLRKLEGQAASLAGRLRRLNSQLKIAIWHGAAAELLDRLERANAAHRGSDELRRALQQEGMDRRTDGTKWNWKRVDERYVAPDRYGKAIGAILEDLEQQTQELMLSDLAASDDTAVPARYQRLVERYIQVLSSDLRQKD